MLIEIIIFIIGVFILSFILYNYISNLWFNNIMKRTLGGEDLSRLTRRNDFKEAYKNIVGQIISQYEANKESESEEDDKNKEMYQ